MECEVEGEPLAPENFTKDFGWQHVVSRRSSVRNSAINQIGGNASGLKPNADSNAMGRADRADLKSKIIRGGRMPPLPKEEAKIVVRPRGGLCISKVGPTVVADAIWQAAGLGLATRDTDTMCPNFQQNIMVISTPSRDNAACYVGIEGITVTGQRFEVSAYEAAPHSTCKGVIRGVPLSDGPAEIEKKLVNSRNPAALGAKRIKKTTTVVVLFDGYRVPNFVAYGGTMIRCTLFRKQMDVCYSCGRLGHRSDVCPSPNDAVCRGCGEANPDAQHRCYPKCKLCGGGHLTAAKECKRRFQTPYLVRRRRGERSRAAESSRQTVTFNDDDFPSMETSNQAQQSPSQRPSARSRSRSKGRSRSRSRSRGRSRSRSISRIRSRSRSRIRSSPRSPSGSRGRSVSRTQPASGHQPVSTRGGRQPFLAWADLVRPNPSANTGAAPGARNNPLPEQARDAEVIRLRKENDDLKKMINRLVNEMAEIRKLVSNTSGNGEAVRATETPVAAPVDGTATSSKRRAVVDHTCESGVLTAEVGEIKQTLTALADGLKQVTANVSLLSDSVRQIQVALGDPNRGLGALADRIDANEARMASPATVVHPLTVPTVLREATLKYPTNAVTECPIFSATLTAPLGGSQFDQPHNG